MSTHMGRPAPGFTTLNQDGEKMSLGDFLGKTVILYFYPKDDTPGCTKEACSFRDGHADLKKKGAVILGVSPDGPASHAKFIKKHGLTFDLLADEDHAIAEAYGVWVEKSMYGKKYMGVERSTFVIDPAGRIQAVFRKVKPDGHAGEVLAAL
jgi:peroxiredoxin Q/BCP